MDNYKDHRKSVAAIIIDEHKNILVFQRKDHPDNFQLPQGGIDHGEDSIDALKRELKEETNIFDFRILRKSKKEYCYDLENYIREGKSYKGQCHYYFLCELTVKFNFIPSVEFISYKWMEPQKAMEKFPYFKQDIIKQVFKDFELI
ncbi:NUDIX domain-containing protein [bacterium]|nr:NUDIX domain-containing protein [bacterium]